MLTIFGQNRSQSHCDGISRRDFIKIGGLSMGTAMSLSLTDLLRAEARAGVRSSHKAVINVFLAGGPPHQDMWDVKTEAPSQIRGEFKPIPTNVPGIEIGEMFPEDVEVRPLLLRVRNGAAARRRDWPSSPATASESAGLPRRTTDPHSESPAPTSTRSASRRPRLAGRTRIRLGWSLDSRAS